MATTFHNFIGGRWTPARSGRTFSNLSPAPGAALGEFPDSGADDVDAAVLAARDAVRACPLTPGDVHRGVDMAYLAAGEGRRLYAVITTSEIRSSTSAARCSARKSTTTGTRRS
jgi:acyl-CoA reductase-like NAD-dependent aldehyde dehydrogenase